MKNPFIETTVTKIAFATPFSANVGNTRRNLSLLQKELAKKLDVAPSSIVNWECGHSTPNLPKFVELCVALNTTPDKLLGFE